jgi:CHAT domain-containing protein/tetratricopeptide (TPR) repeat protein
LGVVLLTSTFAWSDDDSLQKANEQIDKFMQLFEQHRYQEALPYAEKTLAIREKALGPEHLDTAYSLNNLALLYMVLGAGEKAESLFQRSIAIIEKALGPGHPSIASYLNNLITLYLDMGEYDKAQPLCHRSLAIIEKTLGPEHTEIVVSLNKLAELYYIMGAYEKAEPLYKRSLAIREKALGLEHSGTVFSLDKLAELYYQMSAYDKAEPLFMRSLAINEKTLGPEHPETANSLNSLGALYTALGAYEKAEPLYQRSLAIREKALGPWFLVTSYSLNNLAELYYKMGAYEKAEPLYQRSLAIKEKVRGPEHPDTAISLSNLGGLYMAFGAYDKSEPLFMRSLAINENTLGPEHFETANSLNSLGALFLDMRDYDKAEPFLKRSLAIYEKTLGPEHFETAVPLNNLGMLYSTLGRNHDALTLMERVQGIDLKQITQVIGFAPEELQSRFLATSEDKLHSYLSLIHQRFSENLQAKQKALDVWLARKGILMEAQKHIRDILATGEDPGLSGVFNELTHVRADMAKLVLGGFGKEGAEVYQKRIAALTDKKETLEGQLSRLSQSFAKKRKTMYATTVDVAARLPRESALIEIARIKESNFKEGKRNPRYLAFVLPSGKGDDVSLIDLGEAQEIDLKVNALKKSLRDQKTPNETLMDQSKELYQMVFAPLKPAIGKVKNLFLSPDGSLTLIPFEILRDDKGKYLIDTYAFNYVSAGRDIAGFGMVKKKGKKSLLIGDPDFNLASKTPTEEIGITVTRSRQMTGMNFSPLPGTRKEVEAISRLLGHIATHGFFLSDQDWFSLIADKSRGITITAKEVPSNKIPVRIENPLLRAGLALAGANRSLAQEGVTEGILTAEKILGLNLRETDLVVLSACETGVGDVKIGEGVYGLRRVFTQAGAKSLVMSMWEVPDVETTELMINFYSNLQLGKMNRADALRQAVLKQRGVTKSRYRNDHPFYWGAFIFSGEAE